ncbi:MAG: hypothetical protein GF416_07680 [Candidatus Altiarchaeales archaeon]|nr:hypothetical protein [Candidatus Altiarchaeales archaeon]MBD3416992.1 hypothetical protein [Candidatus Altiarchaeales archaeon]
MTKILITSNFHPNEGFAVTVARELSKELRELGYDVVERKFRFDETSLGKVRDSKEPVNSHGLVEYDKEQRRLLDRIIGEVQPDYAFDMHTTPYDPTGQDERSKKRWGTPDPADGFPMEQDYHPAFCLDDALHRTIEVKAVYKPLPELYSEGLKLEPKTRDVYRTSSYFSRTTSQSRTMEEGIEPENLGKTIARHIDRMIGEGCEKPTDFDRLAGKAERPKRRTSLKQ